MEVQSLVSSTLRKRYGGSLTSKDADINSEVAQAQFTVNVQESLSVPSSLNLVPSNSAFKGEEILIRGAKDFLHEAVNGNIGDFRTYHVHTATRESSAAGAIKVTASYAHNAETEMLAHSTKQHTPNLSFHTFSGLKNAFVRCDK